MLKKPAASGPRPAQARGSVAAALQEEASQPLSQDMAVSLASSDNDEDNIDLEVGRNCKLRAKEMWYRKYSRSLYKG